MEIVHFLCFPFKTIDRVNGISNTIKQNDFMPGLDFFFALFMEFFVCAN